MPQTLGSNALPPSSVHCTCTSGDEQLSTPRNIPLISPSMSPFARTTVEGNWLGELLHPRREGSTTVMPGGLVGDVRRCSSASQECWEMSKLSNWSNLVVSSNWSNLFVCVFVMCDRFALRSVMESVTKASCALIALVTSSRTVCAIVSNWSSNRAISYKAAFKLIAASRRLRMA